MRLCHYNGKEDFADVYQFKKGNLTIEYIKAQSLQSNFEEIKMCVDDRDIDVQCVSETWLHTRHS